MKRLPSSADRLKRLRAKFHTAMRADRVVLLADGRAITSWLEEMPGGAEVRAQPFAAQGPVGPVKTIARSAIARSSGFPQMVLDHNRLLFAWTETGEPARIRTAFAELN